MTIFYQYVINNADTFPGIIYILIECIWMSFLALWLFAIKQGLKIKINNSYQKELERKISFTEASP